MDNRTQLAQALATFGARIGCYDSAMDLLSPDAMAQIIPQLPYGSQDIVVTHQQQPYVVELYEVENELDFNLITAEDYELLYGRPVHA